MNTYSPDCLRLKSNMSVSSSISWGGCREAERAEGPLGPVTSKRDIDDEGVELKDFKGALGGSSLEAAVVGISGVLKFSAISISDAPLPVASGMLFSRLIDEVEWRCFEELYPLDVDGIASRECSTFMVFDALLSSISWSLASSLSEGLGEL